MSVETSHEAKAIATKTPRTYRRRAASWIVAGAVTAICLWWLPRAWAQWGWRQWYDGQTQAQAALGDGVWRWIDGDLDAQQFNTGSELFSGEWLFGSYMMAAMGYGQLALLHPELRDDSLARMDACIVRLLSEEVRAFDAGSWGSDPLASLDSPTHHHAAYLGYFNLVLSLHRLLDPDSRHAELNDAITAALIRRLGASELLMIQTYPGEMYPVDNSAVIASIALHGRATGEDHRSLVERWVDNCRRRWVDPRSGLLIQAVDFRDGSPVDQPRGSGTLLAVYFLAYASPELSRDLYVAARRELTGVIGGFAFMREYPVTSSGGAGDIDSGPLVLGYSPSATGFAVAGAKIHREPGHFAELYRTLNFLGAPANRDDGLIFATAGLIGNAIMFAMLTAPPTEVLP